MTRMVRTVGRWGRLLAVVMGALAMALVSFVLQVCGAGKGKGDDEPRDAGQDATIDAGEDAGGDAGRDAGGDAGTDGGIDAGDDAGDAGSPKDAGDLTDVPLE